MKVVASVAVSLDGYIDDTSCRPLRLSSDEDWREVRQLRASCGAILVGAGTVRKDNPSLVIRDEAVRHAREAAGQPADLVKVTISASLDLDPGLRFFTEGEGRKIVFTTLSSKGAEAGLSAVAEVIALPELTPRAVVDALADMGYGSLMVEGGARVLRDFFRAGVVDQLRLAVAPIIVGAENGTASACAARREARSPQPAKLAPRFDPPANLRLCSSHIAGGVTVYEYDVARTEEELLLVAVRESKKCAPVASAYSVGAVIATRAGEFFAGFSRETAPHNHAEEEALAKALAVGAELEGATIYTSMEPCSKRASKRTPCSELITRHRFARVVYALDEPEHFVRCHGRSQLEKAGVEVTVIDKYAQMVRDINCHLLK